MTYPQIVFFILAAIVIALIISLIKRLRRYFTKRKIIQQAHICCRTLMQKALDGSKPHQLAVTSASMYLNRHDQ